MGIPDPILHSTLFELVPSFLEVALCLVVKVFVEQDPSGFQSPPPHTATVRDQEADGVRLFELPISKVAVVLK